MEPFPLPEDELDALWQLNRSPVPAVKACIHDGFHCRVNLHPQKEAVDAWDGSFSYRKLGSLSDLLAYQLKGLGVQHGNIVPLCFEKSRWTVVAMLAVLKTGAAFTLLDTTQPEGRIQEIIEQCDAKIVCTSESTRERLACADRTIHVVGPALLADDKDASPAMASFVDSSWPMYVCWTSGSTGKPKGIVISHDAFNSACHHQSQALGLHSKARVFDFVSYSFDAAVQNAIMTLLAGACICVPSEDQRQGALDAALKDTKATMVALPPSACRLLEPESLPDLDTLELVGEPVAESELQRLRAFSFQVLIGYGPAECTPMSTLNPHAVTTSIGTGIGCTTWIVDPSDENRLLPRGMVGELLIEGPGLAIGYLNEPEKTSASFIHDPSWLLQGSRNHTGRQGRLYKTGDLVRYDENGSTLSFVGRKDAQVKLRGQRIEPGEVEHHIRQIVARSAQIAVLVVELGGDRSKPTLAAFLTRTAEDTYPQVSSVAEDVELVSIAEEAESKLSAELPPFMIPSLYLRIPAMPLGLTGKTDRRALKEIGSQISAERLVELRQSSHGGKKQPQNEAERRLREVWARVLGVSEASVSTDESFVSLGGSSLEAMKLVAEARKAGFALTVSQIFRQSTIAAQATLLRKTTGRNNTTRRSSEKFSLLHPERTTQRQLASMCLSIDPSAIEDAYPCTPLQKHTYILPRRPGDYLLRAILDIPDHVDTDKLKEAWDTVFDALPILRTRIVKHERLGMIQVVCRESIEWNHIQDLQTAVDADVSIGMTLGEPLTRFTLVTTAKSRQLLWTIFHPLYDGWSLPLMIDLVKGVLQGDVQPSDVRNRTSIKAFVQHLIDKSATETREYWTRYLTDVTQESFPALPSTVKNPSANMTIERDLVTAPITPTAVTISTLIRGALGILISFYTKSPDVVFGVTVSGRSAALPGVEEVLGPTIAIVPVRVRTGPQDESHATLCIGELLQRIQQQSLEMIEHEQVGILTLREFNHDCRAACNFQTLMVVHPHGQHLPSDDVLGTWRTVPPAPGLSTVAVTLQFMLLKSGGVKVSAMYDDQIIDGVNMEKMVQQLGLILDFMPRSWDLPLKDLYEILETDSKV